MFFFNPKQLPRILYLSIILQSLKNNLEAAAIHSNITIDDQDIFLESQPLAQNFNLPLAPSLQAHFNREE